MTSAKGNPESFFDLPVCPIGSVDRLPEGEVVVIAMGMTLIDGPAKILKEKNIPYFVYSNDTLIHPD